MCSSSKLSSCIIKPTNCQQFLERPQYESISISPYIILPSQVAGFSNQFIKPASAPPTLHVFVCCWICREPVEAGLSRWQWPMQPHCHALQQPVCDRVNVVYSLGFCLEALTKFISVISNLAAVSQKDQQ